MNVFGVKLPFGSAASSKPATFQGAQQSSSPVFGGKDKEMLDKDFFAKMAMSPMTRSGGAFADNQ